MTDINTHELEWSDTAVWVVYFNYGFVGGDYLDTLGCVRAVRE